MARKRFAALKKKDQLIDPFAEQLQKNLELGCGKGTFTHLLKKQNNEVCGVDLAPTAIQKARQSFPDVTFSKENILKVNISPRFDLVVVMAALADIKNWRKIIKKAVSVGRY